MHLKTALAILLLSILGILLVGIVGEYVFTGVTGTSIHERMHPELYETVDELPALLTVVRESRRASFAFRVQEGRTRCASSSLLITGLARDIAPNIDRIKRRLRTLGSMFREYRIILFENDSVDGTRDALRQWSKENPFVELIECEHVANCAFQHQVMYTLGVTSASRVDRMALFRNRCLFYARRHYPEFDYLCVFDMDIRGPISYPGIASTFGYTDWDMTCAYGMQSIGQYGIGFTMYDNMPYVEVWENPKDIYSGFGLLWRRIYNNFVSLRDTRYGDERRAIRSGFGGLAFYTMESVRNAQYHGGRCEHIGFHESMRERGYSRMFMNPSMMLIAGQQGPTNVLHYLVKAGDFSYNWKEDEEEQFVHRSDIPAWLLPVHKK